jgi:acetoin utilization deacetylase AcuC-like enzyme
MRYSIYWNQQFTASEYAFDTTRKSGEIAAAIAAGRVEATLIDPEGFTSQATDLIRTVHTDEYVRAVTRGDPIDLAQSQGFTWDDGLPTMAIAHSAGLVAAVTEVLSGTSRVAGSLSSGLHHARAGRGAGYCTFNGLAVAGRAAVDQGAGRILVLDLDAHCGGGTRSMTDRTSVVQIDVSTNRFDRWAPSGDDALLFADHKDYLERVDEALGLCDRSGPFDLVLYNAGMDPFDNGVSEETLRVREEKVAEWAGEHGHRLVFSLAGGYTSARLPMDGLVDLHLLTVEAFG